MSNLLNSYNQDASFIFKLRKNIVLEGDLLLAKLELQSFFPHADLHATTLSTLAESTPQITNLRGFGAIEAHGRLNGKQAYIVRGQLSLLPILVRHVSFIQRIYCLTPDTESAQFALREWIGIIGPVFTYDVQEHCLTIQALPHYALIEFSDVVASHSSSTAETKHNLTLTLDALLERTNGPRAVRLANTALSAQSTTSHLSHDIHYYKAKFFPRMARSVLNICVQELGDGPHRAIDNFAGSGTMLLEASLLGVPSVGLDIDPLSVMIAKAKLGITQDINSSFSKTTLSATLGMKRRNTNQPTLFDETPAGHTQSITFPVWLMKNRKMTPEIADELSREIGAIQAVISATDVENHEILRILMSDAITRKVRMRFMGTGVGRFSLTFAKTSIIQMFVKSVENYAKTLAVSQWLQENICLNFASTQILTADTRHIPEDLGLFDILVTSPLIYLRLVVEKVIQKLVLLL